MPSPSKKQPVEYQRNALAPGILAAIACIAGIGIIGLAFGLAIHFIVTILAIIIGWFAFQARMWWWIPIMLVIAVVWNPVFPFALTGAWGLAAHIVAAATFVAAGAMIKTPRPGTERR